MIVIILIIKNSVKDVFVKNLKTGILLDNVCCY